jgi:hypothetical protein
MDTLIIGIILVVAIIAGLVAYGITTKGGEEDLSEDVEVVADPALTDEAELDVLVVEDVQAEAAPADETEDAGEDTGEDA